MTMKKIDRIDDPLMYLKSDRHDDDQNTVLRFTFASGDERSAKNREKEDSTK